MNSVPYDSMWTLGICDAADAQLFSSLIHNDDHVLHPSC